MSRTCIFCDTSLTGVRAREHAIPQWLQEHLGIPDEQLLHGVAQSSDNSVVESRSQSTSSFIEGRVCKSCNNGWMSRLETEAMEILKLLIAGTASLLSISDAERTVVAKWATKTSYVISHATLLKKTPDPSHLRYMRDNGGAVPPRVGVYGSQYPATANFHQLQLNKWPHMTNRPPLPVPPAPLAGSYKIALQFRTLLLLVAYWPELETEQLMAVGVHVPLSPIRQIYPAYYLKLQPISSEPMSPLERFSSALTICDLDFSSTQ
jgi:hypothetical protein